MTKGNLGKIETETWYNLESYIDYGNVQSFFVTKEQPVQYYTSLWSGLLPASSEFNCGLTALYKGEISDRI